MHILLISEASARKLGSQIPHGGKWFSLPADKKKRTHSHGTRMSNLINSAKVAQKWSRQRTPGKPLQTMEKLLHWMREGESEVWEFVPCGAKLTICVQCAKKISSAKTKPKPKSRWSIWETDDCLVWSIFPGTFGRFGSLATPPDSTSRALA